MQNQVFSDFLTNKIEKTKNVIQMRKHNTNM